MCEAEGVFTEMGMLEGVAVCNVVLRGAVQLIWVLVWQLSRSEVVEFVSGP